MKCPIYIVTEYMRNGSLLMYLRQTTPEIIGQATLLDMTIQVCQESVLYILIVDIMRAKRCLC